MSKMVNPAVSAGGERAAPPGRFGFVPLGFNCARTDGFFGARWVEATGDLDRDGAPRLDAMLLEAQRQVPLVVLDVRGLTSIDDLGLHVILDCAASARREGERLIVVRGRRRGDEHLGLTRSSLLEVIEVHADERPSQTLARLTRQAPTKRPRWSAQDDTARQYGAGLGRRGVRPPARHARSPVR